MNVRVVPYSGTVAAFLASRRTRSRRTCSASRSSRARPARRCGVCRSRRAGWNPYASMLVTERGAAAGAAAVDSRHHGGVDPRMEAYVKDPGPTHEYILTRNRMSGREALDQGARALSRRSR